MIHNTKIIIMILAYIHLDVVNKDHNRMCRCERPQYYGAVVSDTNVGWTEFHCNRCGNLISFLNSIDENIYEIIEDEIIKI